MKSRELDFVWIDPRTGVEYAIRQKAEYQQNATPGAVAYRIRNQVTGDEKLVYAEDWKAMNHFETVARKLVEKLGVMS